MKIQTNPALALRARAGLVCIFILVQQFPILTPLACGIIPLLKNRGNTNKPYHQHGIEVQPCYRTLARGRYDVTHLQHSWPRDEDEKEYV